MNNCGDSLNKEHGSFQAQGGGEIPTSPLQFIKSEWFVESIPVEEAKPWITKKHYAHRMPPISYCFGLFQNKKLNGICSFGVPISPELKKACGDVWSDKFYELNRLCVNEGLPKNSLSFFVSKSLKLMPSPCIIVSYADTSQGHHGYIYQATNWIYTGMSLEIEDYMVKGLEHMHGASIMDSVGRSDNGKVYGKSKVDRLKEKYGDRLYKAPRPRKHRYFQFIGDKKQVKDMANSMKYKTAPYPKGENKRYDASYKPEIQGVLF